MLEFKWESIFFPNDYFCELRVDSIFFRLCISWCFKDAVMVLLREDLVSVMTYLVFLGLEAVRKDE